MEMIIAKERLEVGLREAEAEQEQIEQQLKHKPEFGLGTGSPGTYTWELALARKEEVAAKIEALQTALSKVREGTYGQCERCGRQINPERLEILPTTTLCADCAGASPTPV